MREPGKEVALRIGTGCCFRILHTDRTCLVDLNLVIIIIITLFSDASYIGSQRLMWTNCEVISERTKNIYIWYLSVCRLLNMSTYGF